MFLLSVKYLKNAKVVEVFLENGENAQEDTLLASGMKVSMDASVYIVVILECKW